MPSYSNIIKDPRKPEVLRDLLVKAIVLNGCEPVQLGDIIVAKRGMQGVSWAVEITFQLTGDDTGTTILANGSIGGYGPIQQRELNKCAESILATLSTLKYDSRIAEVQSSSSEIDEIHRQARALDQSLQQEGQGSRLTPIKTPELSPNSVQNTTDFLSYSMDSTTLFLIKDFSPQEKVMFMSEYNANKKTVTAGILLALVLGGLGIHKFWLGSAGMGILYLIFCWTFIPAFVAIIDACLMGNSVKKYNGKVANDAYQKIMMMR
jgi:TM2 domain-containing membrane protein YozV